MVRINADDFGYSLKDNECILECFKRHYIQSTSIMVNAPYFDNAVILAKRNKLDRFIGLHLNITEFSPVSVKLKNNNKFYKNGCFSINRKRMIFRLPHSDILSLEEEIENQMKIFRKYFPYSIFLDSHHHIHTAPAILNSVLKLAKKYDFQVVRISKNIGVKSPVKRLGKYFLNKKIARHFPKSCSFFCYPIKEDVARALKTKNVDCEIMVHPCFENGNVQDKYSKLGLSDIKGMIDEN